MLELSLKLPRSNLGSLSHATFLLGRALETSRTFPARLSTRYKDSFVAHLLQLPVEDARLLGHVHLVLARQMILDGRQGRSRPLLLGSDGIYHHVLELGVFRLFLRFLHHLDLGIIIDIVLSKSFGRHGL